MSSVCATTEAIILDFLHFSKRGPFPLSMSGDVFFHDDHNIMLAFQVPHVITFQTPRLALMRERWIPWNLLVCWHWGNCKFCFFSSSYLTVHIPLLLFPQSIWEKKKFKSTNVKRACLTPVQDIMVMVFVVSCLLQLWYSRSPSHVTIYKLPVHSVP